MSNDKPFSRKDFIKTAGGSAMFAAVCLACGGCNTTDSGGNGGGGPTNPPPPGPDPNDPESGIDIDGSTVTIDLTKDDVASLRNAGGWMVISSAGMLVLNVNGDTFRAFTNVCTHEGTTSQWSYSTNSNEFTCNEHGSRFDSSGEWAGGSFGNTGDLTQYAAQRSGDMVTITK